MTDSRKDEKQGPRIFNRTTGEEAYGISRGKQPRQSTSMTDQQKPVSSGSTSLDESSASDGEQAIGTASGKKPATDKRKERSSLTRVYDIVKRFYSSTGMQKKIPEPALKKLEERSLSEPQHQELLELAQREDVSLARTVNLAFAAFEIQSNRTIRDLLLKFAIDAGRKGFDLPMESQDEWLPLTEDDRLPIAELFKRYATRAELIKASSEPAKEKKERQAKLHNLLYLSLIWQASLGWASEEDVMRFLRADRIFETRTHYPSQAIEALLKAAYGHSAADFSPIGWLSRQVEITGLRQSSELERLQREVEKLNSHQTRALEELERRRQENTSLEEQKRQLEEVLNQERRNAQTASVHLKDDKHRLRSQVTKTLKNEVPRLEEALVALQRDPPKLHIVSHYVEETLNNIKKVLRETEGE
ncbi:hypothetical protein R5M92_12845 [Halomonas sp. Bachu 37]|uniref:hypothetical protein n=1 Tax=Halomonas kashgarensis TaxID=3084920 RepID=UPI003216E431